MPAGYQTLQLEQGTDFTIELTLNDVNGVPYDLSNFDIKSQFKKSYYSNVATDFSISIGSAIGGVITLNLDSTASANVSPGKYVYDVLLKNKSDNTKIRILEGVLNVSPAVSHF